MRDFFGNLLSEGDYVVYPHKVADRLHMTVRYVTRVDVVGGRVWSRSVEQQARWSTSGYVKEWGLTHREGKPAAVFRSETMVRVPRESVPDEARALLNPEEFL